MIQTCYGQDEPGAILGANAIGAAVLDRLVDPTTYEPDWVAVGDGQTAIICLAGTTNLAQWLGHAGSTVAPYPVNFGGKEFVVVASFWLGVVFRFPRILQALAPYAGKRILLAGHSYGGAAAYILSNDFGNPNVMSPTPYREVLTFGEPKSFGGGTGPFPPDKHVRIVTIGSKNALTGSKRDPVTMSPPSVLALYSSQKFLNILKFVGGVIFAQDGPEYYLYPDGPLDGPHSYPGLFLVPFTEIIAFLGNAADYASLHYLNTSYLAKSLALAQAAGCQNLASLFARAAAYASGGVPPTIQVQPTLTADQINQGWGLSAGTVTEPNRATFATISAAATVVEPLSFYTGGSDMSIMKGTIEFNSEQGGWSESCYSSVPGETIPSMLQKMTGLLGKRMLLSFGQDTPGCQNPINPYAIRVEDTLGLRNSADLFVLPPGAVPNGPFITVPPSYISVSFGFANPGTIVNSNQNLDLELGTRVRIASGNPLEYASPMFHGIPFSALSGGASNLANAFTREASFSPTYQTQLQIYLGYMAAVGLGYRNISGAWNQLTGSPPVTTNLPGPWCKPTYWYYDPTAEQIILLWTAAGNAGPQVGTTAPYAPTLAWQPPYNSTQPSQITLQAPLNYPSIGSLVRVQVRAWKGFQVLNGRWTAEVVGPGTFQIVVPPATTATPVACTFGLKLHRQVRMPQIPSTNVPNVSPIAWNVWYPNQANNTGVNAWAISSSKQAQTPPGFALPQSFCSIQYVESKKLGRNFGEERGRQRNRPQ